MFRAFSFLLLASGAFLGGCTQTELKSDGSQSILSSDSYLSSTATIRLYWKNSGLGTFVTYISPIKGKIILPRSVQKDGDFGRRSSMTALVPLDVVAMVFNPSHPSGDFYFEAPVLGPELAVSNVTTALSWYLRWGFAEAPLKLTQEAFDQMVLNIEVICTECRKKTNSEVLELIRSTPTLVNAIRAKVIALNPVLDLSNSHWAAPKAHWAWSEPLLNISTGLKSLKETQQGSFSVLYVNPLNSTQKIVPTAWTDPFTSSTKASESDGSLLITPGYDDAGVHQISPIFPTSIDGVVIPQDGIVFTLSVDDSNRLPLCVEPLIVAMRANVLNTSSLNSLCSDPDPDNGYLNYSLESGPAGITVNSTGLLRWTPPSQGPSLYLVPFSFRTTDARAGMIVSSGNIHVTPDTSPHFVSIGTDYHFAEGVEGSFTVTAQDEDGDPLNLTMVALNGGVIGGFPLGAGDLSKITRSGSDGQYSFDVKFTPSYLQTLGGSGTVQVALRLSYDNSTGVTYDNTLLFDERLLTFHITNQDDPPIFVDSPQDLTAVEGVDLGGVYIGRVEDPLPNPSALSFSVTSASGEHSCEWSSALSVTESAGDLFLHGIPAYFTRDECQFRVAATDSNLLTTYSRTFTITTANTNQPITLCSTTNACNALPLPQVDGTEGKPLTLPLNMIFNDPDMDSTPTDERESYTYDCFIDLDHNGTYETSCASQTSLGFQFTRNILSGSLNPASGTAGTYPVRLSVTDVGGAVATHDFNLVIAEYATPMILTHSLSTLPTVPGLSLSSYELNEGSTYYLTLRAEAASSRLVDSYQYSVMPSCSVIGGSGTCSVSLITPPSDLGGLSTQDFVFRVTPSFADADTTYPQAVKRYAISFFLQKSDDSTVFSQTSAVLVVNNTNRAPTAIGLNKGSFGCTGSAENSGSDPFIVCINGANDTKNGNTWVKSYAINLTYTDPDLTNGSYTYTLGTGAPGSITDGVWTIKLPSCAYPSAGTLTRTYMFTLHDGYGGTISREIQLKVQKVGAASNCM